MGFAQNVGKYQIGRMIGEGMFAKVKLALDSTNGQSVAVKILDKNMVKESNLKFQVQREIRTMKLLNHPNIVRIHEVLGSKTKIYIVMEYVSGGQLSDKMSYAKKLGEAEARKLFQQLIDAVDCCHNNGVYHRDLKPENLLLDSKGNLKVSDFGLSALRKPGDILSTACGSPSYVAPELLVSKGYDGAAADVWSCGVILFELLAGYLPFDDRNLMNLYRKICKADYKFPEWFTKGQKKLISRILEPNPVKRITISEIIEDEWFQKDYVPTCGNECDEKIYFDDVNAVFDSIEDKITDSEMTKSSSIINAFKLIAMSNDLDLSGLFEEEDENKRKTRLGSKHTFLETVKRIEAAATDVSLSVEIMNNFKVQNGLPFFPRHKRKSFKSKRFLFQLYQMTMHQKSSKPKMIRCSRSYPKLSAEVIEVTPTNCVVEISKSAGELRVYKEFCQSLSSLLAENSDLLQTQETKEVKINSRSTEKCSLEMTSKDIKERGYSSS